MALKSQPLVSNHVAQFSVRVVIRNKGTHWLAQCAEYDVAAQGTSFEHAVVAMRRTLIGQILLDLSVGKRPFEDCPKPPPEVLARFANSADQPDTHRFEIPSDVATSLPPTFILDPKVAEMRVYRA